MIPKFRAWDKKHKQMFEVIKIQYNPNLYNIAKKPSWILARAEEEIELMQSTGLKDKNGTEIYEGDVVEILKGFLNVIDYRQDDGCWRLKPLDEQFACSYFSNYDNKSEWLVIGNIYENMELLEV